MHPPVNVRHNTKYMQVECYQDWESMQPIEKGRFCDSCRKPVFDFTGWERDRIRDFYKEHPTACGLFRVEQLDSSLHPIDLSFNIRLRHLLIPFLAFIGLPNLKAQDKAPNTASIEVLPDTTDKSKLKPKDIAEDQNTGKIIQKGDKKYIMNPPIAKGQKEKKEKLYRTKRFPFIKRRQPVWMGCPRGF